MSPEQWQALSAADKDVMRHGFQAMRQNKDYSDKIDMWYGRDVYRVGKGTLLLGLLAGGLGLGIFGLLFLAFALGL